jgi:hypothetical protein
LNCMSYFLYFLFYTILVFYGIHFLVQLIYLRVEQTNEFKKYLLRTNTETLFEAGELIAKY